jgi:hypothetical protein
MAVLSAKLKNKNMNSDTSQKKSNFTSRERIRIISFLSVTSPVATQRCSLDGTVWVTDEHGALVV